MDERCVISSRQIAPAGYAGVTSVSLTVQFGRPRGDVQSLKNKVDLDNAVLYAGDVQDRMGRGK